MRLGERQPRAARSGMAPLRSAWLASLLKPAIWPRMTGPWLQPVDRASEKRKGRGLPSVPFFICGAAVGLFRQLIALSAYSSAMSAKSFASE